MTEKPKVKLALYWAAGCGGCDIAVLELHERILELAKVAEIVFWPCVFDFKTADVETMPDGHIDVCLFNGAIRTEENLDLARLLRKKSKTLVAYGACATMGGIPGLANLYSVAALLERTYCTCESNQNPDRTIPVASTDLGGGKLVTLPALLPRVKALHQEVAVDYLVPGCPPTDKQTWAVIEAVVSGQLPERGSVVGAGNKSVCDECRLLKRETRVRKYVRISEIIPMPDVCLLEQGLVCSGPATRSGCGAQCLSVNMPCRGCYGPAGDAADQGAEMVGLLGSLLETEDETELRACMDGVADPAGTLYRFGLPASILGGAKTSGDGTP